ncbi:MAG: histidine phosphatase family protein [Patescibacteria group bacterium]|nr:histidine phosphatase family protein [Patescibacteria group bacterium]
MIELYIIRHGETDFNKNKKYLGRINISLNSAGIAQAKKLVEKTSNLNFDVIYCSSLKRTIETAKFIKSKYNCEIIIDDHFIERSVGIYEGLTKEEAKNRYFDLYKQNITRIFNKAMPNGETINEVIKRVFYGLDEIKKQNKYFKIIIITHGFVAKVINKYFNPKISEQEFFDFSLSNTEIKKYTFKDILR